MELNITQELNITSLNDLQTYAKGTIVSLPDFADGMPFVARVRRPSMLVLAKQGKIPNSLLTAASELFAKGGAGMDPKDTNMLEDMYDICKVICESTLIEPTFNQIEEAGLALTDEQMMALFNYTQMGSKALEEFRKK